MSNLVDHANRELDLLGYPQITTTRLDYSGFNPEESLPGDPGYEFDPDLELRKNILELIEVFAQQGHSGFSAAYLISMLNKLMDFKPLSPLTDRAEDWIEVSDNMWQNVRDSECFSHDAGKTYYRLSEERKSMKKLYWLLPSKMRPLVWNRFRFLLTPLHSSKAYKELVSS